MGDKETKKEEDVASSKKCAHTGKVLKRAKRYFRNGKYFVNKNAYKGFVEKNRANAAGEVAEGEEGNKN